MKDYMKIRHEERGKGGNVPCFPRKCYLISNICQKRTTEQKNTVSILDLEGVVCNEIFNKFLRRDQVRLN